MELGNGRLIYDGVQKTLSGKAAFMEMALANEKVRQCIGDKLIEDKLLRKKLKVFSASMEDGEYMRFAMESQDLEVIFNLLYGEDVREVLEHEDPVVRLYGMTVMEDAKEMNLDITYFLLYAVIANEACCWKLQEELPDGASYYEYWEKSSYRNSVIESYVNTEQIWPLRKLMGLLEKLRSEPERGPSYRIFMRIVYAGYGKLRRQLKGEAFVGGQRVKELLGGRKIRPEEQLMVLSQTVLALVIAEDMDARIMWDYDMIVMMRFYQRAQREFESCIDGDAETAEQENGLPVDGKMDDKDFLRRFDEKYELHNSLTNLVLYDPNEDSDSLAAQVMAIFRLDPRKFWQSKLTEEECSQILRKSEKWTLKKYYHIQIIAQLCKYIQNLEQAYLKIFGQYERYREHDRNLSQEEDPSLNVQKKSEESEARYCAELTRLKAEKQQLQQVVVKQEQQIARFQRQLQSQEEQLRENAQELGALRTYVYVTGETKGKNHRGETGLTIEQGDDAWSDLVSCEKTIYGENTEEDEAHRRNASKQRRKQNVSRCVEDWKKKKVLVVGGHVNWQNKLKELFPGWQFVDARRKTLDGDAVVGKDFIICNTETLNHACYFKLMAEKRKNQKLFYVRSSNIERCIWELEAQMG